MSGISPFMLLLACALAAVVWWPNAAAQTRLPEVTSAPVLPEPIYWKQYLFVVPYQWGSAAEASAAQSVSLFVSKDRGVTWLKISDARPNVTSFNYRAEGDGEYWFAVRTIDRFGRAWPAGAYQPELRVIVDTAMPQLHEVSAGALESGAIDLRWRASDAHLDPASLKAESQDASGTWQSIPADRIASNFGPQGMTGIPSEIHSGQMQWTPDAAARPVAVRVTVADLAGNTATFQSPIGIGSAVPGGSFPPMSGSAIFSPPAGLPTSSSPPGGWVSSSVVATQPAAPATTQPWPATTVHRAPFRLFSSGPILPDDGVTAYGNPPAVAATASAAAASGNDGRVEARLAGTFSGGPPASAELPPATISPPQTLVPVAPLRPAAVSRLPATGAPGEQSDSTLRDPLVPTHTPSAPPKLVGSRTFALEYDVADGGRWGITKVELWGTRDGGRSWQSYGRDDDLRSPLVATVEGEGLYGFRIVMESAGTIAQPPAPGAEPELWVSVDMHRPVVELTALERGQGNLSDHLILRWRAVDDNLEPRPISLFYSSRPSGPWSAIAANLENTGDYPWRVERHVPSRFYVRVEARDVAGNLAAFQTRDPIEFGALDSRGQLLDAESMGPTATGIDGAYR